MPDDIVTDTNVQTAYGKNSAAGELATIVTVRGATIVWFLYGLATLFSALRLQIRGCNR